MTSDINGTVIAIQGEAIDATPPNDQDALVWDATDGYWKPSSKVAPTRQVNTGTGLTGGGDLSADRTLSIVFGTTSTTACVGDDDRLSDSRSPSGTAGGDLAGTYPNPTVAKINATTVSTAGGSLTAGEVLRVTGSSTVDYGAVDLANSNAITGVLPTGNQANQSLGGDLSGTTNSATVTKIQGNAVKAETEGATQDGYVLTWKNSNNEWEAKPVTTSTITGNLAGDVTGSLTATVVSAISGSSPIIISPENFQWIDSVTPSLNQVSTSSGNAHSFNITAQDSTAVGGNGGDINLTAGKGLDTSASSSGGNINIQGGSNSFNTGNAGSVTIQGGNLNMTGTLGNAGDIFIKGGTVGGLSMQAGNSGTVHISGGSVASGAGPHITGQVLINGGDDSSNSKLGGDVIIRGGQSSGKFGGAIYLNASSLVSDGYVALRTHDTARLTVGATGIITIANLGTGIVHTDSSGNLTSSLIVNADIASSAAIAVSKLAAGTAGQVLINNTTPTPIWTTLSSDITINSSGVTTVNSISGSSPIAIMPAHLQWITGTTLPLLNQADNTTNSATATDLKIQAQNATGTTSIGGNLKLTSGTGTSSDGYVILQTGGTTRLKAFASGVIAINNLSTGIVHADSAGNLTSSTIVNADVSSSAAIAYSKLNLSASIVNADIASSAAIAVSKLAAGSSQQVLITNNTGTPIWTTFSGDVTVTANGSTTVTAISGSGPIIINQTELRWSALTSIPKIDQAAPATVVLAGTPGSNMALTAQFGGATNGSGFTGGIGGNLTISAGTGGSGSTGTNCSGGAGGNLVLSPGVGGTKSGSGTAGIGGVVSINGGITYSTRTITTTYTVDTGSITADYCILCNQSAAFTLTLPLPTNGRTLFIKDIAGNANTQNITISQHSSEKIDGANIYVLNLNYAGIQLTSDGTNWFVMGSYKQST